MKIDHAKQVSKIIVRCMTGNSKALFRNFAEANDVDLIYCPDDYCFKPVHARSVNPLRLFQKCGIPVIKTSSRKTAPFYATTFFTTVTASAQ
jgi:hypothetical protein